MDKSIKVTNNSEFGVRFSVIYYYNGKRIINKPQSGIKQLTTRTIKVPVGATNIKINIEIAIKVGVWFHFFHKSLSVAEDKCFKVSGTKYTPKCREISC